MCHCYKLRCTSVVKSLRIILILGNCEDPDKMSQPIPFHLNLHCLPKYPLTGLPPSGKKFWKMKNFPGQGKVKELHFQSGKFKKNEKSHGKVREFQNFPKKDAS